MRFDVELEEKRVLTIQVEAESEWEALERAQAMYGGGEASLDAYSGASVYCKGVCGNSEMKMGSWEA